MGAFPGRAADQGTGKETSEDTGAGRETGAGRGTGAGSASNTGSASGTGSAPSTGTSPSTGTGTGTGTSGGRGRSVGWLRKRAVLVAASLALVAGGGFASVRVLGDDGGQAGGDRATPRASGAAATAPVLQAWATK